MLCRYGGGVYQVGFRKSLLREDRTADSMALLR